MSALPVTSPSEPRQKNPAEKIRDSVLSAAPRETQPPPIRRTQFREAALNIA